MKKLILVLIMVFAFNLVFATSFDNDVGKKQDKIEYNQNLNVTMTAINVVQVPFFSELSVNKAEVSAMYIDSLSKERIVESTEVKLPDINSNSRCKKFLTLYYTNYKIGSSGGLYRS